MSYVDRVALEAALRDLSRADPAARAAAEKRQAMLTKPARSLGRLEEIAVHFAGWQRCERPCIERGRAAIFAGNHGVAVHGVSAYPAEVTTQMVANFRAGGAAINAIAGATNLELIIVALELDRPTADFTQGPAMTEAECLAAMSAGANVVEPDLDLLVVGEMGIANSTAAAALCARSLGGTAGEWVGPGTGLDATGIQHKIKVIDRALEFHSSAPLLPLETLRRLGGREIAAIAGAVIAARLQRIPVVLDGFICCSALAPFAKEFPGIADHCLAGHRSAEPGHRRLLEQLGLDPLLDLGMRLGEGSGAAVAVAVIRAALAVHDRMATFAEASVAGAR